MPGKRSSLPKQSKEYGVGKEIGGSVYVHRDHADRLGAVVVKAAGHLPDGFVYTIVKYNRRTGAVSFIHCPDWDTAPEPVVGDLWTVHADGRAAFRRQAADPFIYHHKWLFVTDDYPGFDVGESRQRSEAWTALPDVDRSRIGKRSFWLEKVLPLLDRA